MKQNKTAANDSNDQNSLTETEEQSCS